MWRRGETASVGGSIRQVLEVTRRFEAAAGWSLNLRKSRQFANTDALRKWPAACGGGVPASTTFRDLGV
eukprot:1752476-Lingulodinium_polyedra.AAC.1